MAASDWIFPTLLLLFLTGLVIFPFWWARRQDAAAVDIPTFERQGIVGDGTFLGYEIDSDRDTYVMYEFTPEQWKKPIRCRKRIDAPPGKRKPGTKIRVKYLPGSPRLSYVLGYEKTMRPRS